MRVFNEYALYYDLLYRDKDYAKEAEYIHSLIQAHAPRTNSILNLGCGSGRHDQELIRFGYQITGVDLSEEMLAIARQKADEHPQLSYRHGDIRTLRLGQQFDVVVALFHVISYQTTNNDLKAAFDTARKHLKPGGIFIFDCWYGPGVLTDLPTVRVKELEDDRLKITRIAQPTMHPNENIVDVQYQMFIKNKQSNTISEINETHKMRYLFVPEIEKYTGEAGLRLLLYSEWMTEQRLGLRSWNGIFICI